MMLPVGWNIDRVLSGLLHFGPRYSAVKKLPALLLLLPNAGPRKLPEVAAGVPGPAGTPVHVLIAGFDYDRNIAAFFRSAKVGDAEWGEGSASEDVTLAQAIHASSNAPVLFFDEPATWDDGASRYWDGAISGCNNPVLAGVAEAITLQVAPTDIRALAIGTATVRRTGPPRDNPGPYYAPRSSQDFPSDIGKLAASITDDPPDIASFLAHVMTGGAIQGPGTSRVVRMNPMVCPVPDGAGGWKPPGGWSVDQLKHLASIDITALEHTDVEYISRYADFWLADQAPNQPIRMSADTLTSKLGPDTHQGALAAWRAIS